MTTLSYKMRTELREIASPPSWRMQMPGAKEFTYGWPTYEALERRGLVTIRWLSGIRWLAELTDEGWEASGVERPA